MRVKFLTLILLFTSYSAFNQDITSTYIINWHKPHITPPEALPAVLQFEDAAFEEKAGFNPLFSKSIPLGENYGSATASISNTVFAPLTHEEILLLDNLAAITPVISPEVAIAGSRGVNFARVSFLPFCLNMASGKFEKLIRFDLTVTPEQTPFKSSASSNFADNSVLASGNWFRIKLNQDGIYRVTYEELNQMGVAVTGLRSENIRLYGNGGGMLPELNSTYRPDDLLENAIEVVDGGDGNFNPGDYFLFYGQSPDRWVFNQETETFNFRKHIYSDYTYYYITVDKGPGKRIATIQQASGNPNQTITTFNDFAAHEEDNVALIKSGRKWYGEIFDLITTQNFTFQFPNLVPDVDHYLRISTVAKANLSTTFNATINGSPAVNMIISGTPDNPNGDYAKSVERQERITLSSDDVNISLKYNKASNNSIGWLDFIELNVLRNLTFTGGQMHFRSMLSAGDGNVSQFTLAGAGNNVKVWDITSQANVGRVDVSNSGNNATFKLETDMIREFVAFDGSQYLSMEFDQVVENQNLHGERNIEYLIVTHPDFLAEAERLAAFHRNYSGLSALVATTEQVYNEFSSGAQDITAIKDFARMFYERGLEGDVMIRYLLLFGDASYDFKDRIQDNTNFVPTYQSPNSLHYIQSYATDDYFGYLDPDESAAISDMVDIGIGRFVVTTPEEAKSMVDKVIHYANSEDAMGSWRNVITFVGDDEDGNVHTNQANQLATYIDTTFRNYNVDKIYIDAYQQESTTGGSRYPEVNQAINTSIARGTLIMNYTGHGGEVGWAHERILEVPDIISWTNYDKLSIFVTATCTFARYDDPGRISAGEYVFLNPNGGGIALFTTARATFGGSNLTINKKLYENAFVKKDGEYPTMGDLIRISKVESTSATNDKKFLLIGDPALKMAYPDYTVKTADIQSMESQISIDTLKALSSVTIKGHIVDDFDNIVSDFNGHLQASVYDKETDFTTLGQDPSSTPRTFSVRKNIIYKGLTSVENGEFTFSFIVPKDIAYNFGSGKISYYAVDGLKSAAGYDPNIIIGGFDANNSGDLAGPEIKLFMNDTTFKSGDITHQNPTLLAHIFDESGVNTVGNSIGHDIVAILNNNTDKPFNLNDYYQSDLQGFKSGTVRYPFSNLPPGEYELRFRIWDVYNNPSEAYLKFVVVDKDVPVINNAYNRPNPFSYETWFEYNHNQAGEATDVTIDIYNLSGQLVTQLQQNNQSSSFSPEPLRWDGTASNGNTLNGGVYIYRVTVKNQQGKAATAVKKLVIAR
jgi:hypothetical protein